MAQKRKQEAETALASPAVPWWREVLREPIALGLAPVILLRPFSDGPTYPTNNLYSIAAILALLAVVAARMLFRGEPIRFATPTLLLLSFWVVAVLMSINSVQFDATYRTILIWAGHLALLFVVLNGVRTRMGIGIILAAVVAALFVEAAWSLVHLKYLLPFVRDSVMHDPQLRKAYFGSEELDAELIHRLEVNRAFGSLLFPNALAALLVVGIPYAAAGMFQSIWSLRKGRGEASVPETPFVAFVTGGLTWVAVLCTSFFVFTFIASFEYPLPRGLERSSFLPLVYLPDGSYHLDARSYVILWVFFVVLLPLIAGAIAGWQARCNGMAGLARRFRAVAFPVAFVVMSRSLWLTYSRGALLGLGMAVLVLGAALLLQRHGRGRFSGRASAAALAVVALATLCSAVADQASPAQPQPAQSQPAQAAPAPAEPGAPAIRRQGVDLTTSDLMNPASFKLRLTYWETGWKMAKQNWLTGVGLGNFGTAYPKYQAINAGDVRAAHNDYLQAFCETGVLGGLLFAAFWGYFTIWGLWRLLRERDWMERVALGGIYLGVLAFLIHSFLDFNFFNSALAFFAVLFAGIFFARSDVQAPAPGSARKKSSQVLAVPILAATAIIAGMLVPVFVCDFIMGGHSFLNVGDNKRLNAVLDAGVFFTRAVAAPRQAGEAVKGEIAVISKLIPNRKVVESFGTICVIADGNPPRYRELRQDEPVPRDADVFITNPRLAKQKGCEFAESFLKSLAVIDGIFPHNPEWAAYFVQWYDMLASTASESDARQRYAVEFLKWAEAAVKRSPEQALFREWYGKALWLRGNVETGPGRRSYFERGLDEYKTATELYPTSPYLWHRYGEALVKYGEALNSGSNKTAGESFISKGKEAQRRSAELQKAKGTA